MAEPTHVRELLATFPGMVARLAETRLLRAWPEIAGPAARRSRAESIQAGVLHVIVDSSGWLHRLTFEEASLLVRCQAIADVRAIRFHLAPLDAAARPAGPRGAPGPAMQADQEVRGKGDVRP